MAPRSSHSAALKALVPALLEFERAPGRYALALREPRPLFDATLAVMQLAAGRAVEGLPPLKPGQHTGAIQQAARFFVRTVLLRPGADHYSLLGLAPDFEPATLLRDHYRLMIRLTHPDFAASGGAWPADAASRINIANDVLGSVVKRAEYDARLKNVAGASPLAQALVPTVPVVPELEKPWAETRQAARTDAHTAASATAARLGRETLERAARRHRKIVLAGVGAAGCVALLWALTPGGTDGSLVAQRRAKAPDAAPLATADPRQRLAPAVEPEGSALARAKAWLANQAEAPGDTSPASPAASASPPAAAASLPAPVVAAPPMAKAEPVADAKGARVKPAPPAKPANSANSAKQVKPADAAVVAPAVAGKESPANAPDDQERLTLGMDPHLSLSTQPAPAAPPVAWAGNPLTMAQVQPKLAQVLSGLKSGKGENVLQWLEGPWRENPAARDFLNNYQLALAGHSVVQLGKVRLRSRSLDQQLVVDGVVELYLQGGNAEPHIKELQMSAHFLPRDGNGQPMLTQVVLKHP
jgi:hypothetical protein